LLYIDVSTNLAKSSTNSSKTCLFNKKEKERKKKGTKNTRSLGPAALLGGERGALIYLATGHSAAPAFCAATRTGARRPFPPLPPPQLRHGARRVPAHAPQPEESRPPSDQRTHRRHSSFPVPPHVVHGGADDDEEEEQEVLAMATPASMPRPAEATAIAATIFSLSVS
jgi:hypothetical protein